MNISTQTKLLLLTVALLLAAGSAQAQPGPEIAKEVVRTFREADMLFAQQQETLFKAIFAPDPNLYANFYIGGNQYFDPMAKSIQRAKELGRTDLLPYLINPQKLETLEPNRADPAADGVSYDMVTKFVQNTTAEMLSGKYADIPTVNANYHSSQYQQALERHMKWLENNPLVDQTKATPFQNANRLTPADKDQLAYKLEEIYERVTDETDCFFFKKIVFKGMEISPWKQAFYRAKEEGNTLFVSFLSSKSLMTELRTAFQEGDYMPMYQKHQALFDKLELCPEASEDFELTMNDVWLNIYDFVQNTTKQMIRDGKSWDGNSLEQIGSIDNEYFSSDFLRRISE